MIENMIEENCMSSFNYVTIKYDNKKCCFSIFIQYAHLYCDIYQTLSYYELLLSNGIGNGKSH